MNIQTPFTVNEKESDFILGINQKYLSVISQYLPQRVIFNDKLVASFDATVVGVYRRNVDITDVPAMSDYDSIYFDIIQSDGTSNMIHMMRTESYNILRDEIISSSTPLKLSDGISSLARKHNEMIVEQLNKVLKYQASCQLIHKFGSVKCAYGDITLVSTIEKFRKCLIRGIDVC